MDEIILTAVWVAVVYRLLNYYRIFYSSMSTNNVGNIV